MMNESILRGCWRWYKKPWQTPRQGPINRATYFRFRSDFRHRLKSLFILPGSCFLENICRKWRHQGWLGGVPSARKEREERSDNAGNNEKKTRKKRPRRYLPNLQESIMLLWYRSKSWSSIRHQRGVIVKWRGSKRRDLKSDVSKRGKSQGKAINCWQKDLETRRNFSCFCWQDFEQGGTKSSLRKEERSKKDPIDRFG